MFWPEHLHIHQKSCSCERARQQHDAPFYIHLEAACVKSSPMLQHMKKMSEELDALADAALRQHTWLLSRQGVTLPQRLPQRTMLFLHCSYLGVCGCCNHPLDVKCKNCSTASTFCFFQRFQSCNPPDRHQTRAVGRRRDKGCGKQKKKKSSQPRPTRSVLCVPYKNGKISSAKTEKMTYKTQTAVLHLQKDSHLLCIFTFEPKYSFSALI